jgi:AcrR family transcriptional regulator
MGRRKTLPDETVLAGARAAFLKFGHSASTRDIAESIGISQATLFQRHGDKADLFVAAMLPDRIDIAYVLDGAPARPFVPGRRALLGIALRLHETLSDRLPLIRTLAGHPHLDPAILAHAHERLGAVELVAAIRQRLQEWRVSGRLPEHLDPSVLTEALLLAVHGNAMMQEAAASHGAHETRARLDRFVDLIWR